MVEKESPMIDIKDSNYQSGTSSCKSLASSQFENPRFKRPSILGTISQHETSSQCGPSSQPETFDDR